MKNLEAMAYKMQPAGHEEPDKKRKYENPPNKLKETFEKWLKVHENADEFRILENNTFFFDSALGATSKLEVGLADVNALLVTYADHQNTALAGFFASALYTRIPEKEILLDLPLEQKISYLGFKLPKDKILISKIPTGDCLGKFAEGTIINESDTMAEFGDKASGIVINYGKTERHSCGGAKGPIINYGNCGVHFAEHSKSVVINMGKAEEEFAAGAEGIAINFGTAGDDMGSRLEHRAILINDGNADRELGENAIGLILCFNNPKSYADMSQGIVKKAKQCSKFVELRKYLDNLKSELEKGRNDYKTAIKVIQEVKKAAFEVRLPLELIEQYKKGVSDAEDDHEHLP